jgi:hypothetical protein
MMHLKLTLPSLTSIKKRKYFMYMLSNRVVCDRYFDAHAAKLLKPKFNLFVRQASTTPTSKWQCDTLMYEHIFMVPFCPVLPPFSLSHNQFYLVSSFLCPCLVFLCR